VTTENQIEANRQNALVSTGPRTIEGKAITAKNAVKHGIFARELVISDGDGRENREEFDQLFQQLVDDLNPEGQMEVLLVEKIAVNYWRLKRLVRYETGGIRGGLDNFRESAVERYYDNSSDFMSTGSKKKHRPAMEYYDYDDEVTEKEIEEQTTKIEKMEGKDYDWSKDSEFEGFLKERYSSAETKGFSGNKLTREKKKYLQGQRQILEEMKEVWSWKKRFEVIGMRKIVPDEHTLDKINKYENSLERSIFRNLAVLKQLQQVRLRSRN
jgi:hypothetical protein